MTENRAVVMRFMRWRVLIIISAAVVLVAVAGLGWGGWYLSDVLKDGALVPKRDAPQHDLEVVALGEGRVTLRVTPESDEDGPWTKDGIWGLSRDAGYDQVRAILEIGKQHVVREFFPITHNLKVGEKVRLDSFTFPGDPQTALGLPFEEVSFASPSGDFPAWFVDGPSDTWAIFVHGKGADRREALRMLPTVAELGLPSLIITYRNDAGLPANPDGFYRYGQTEWEDLEGAVSYAIGHGAEDIVLVGYSMGGAIVANFLYKSPLAERVMGVILDAPMINFNATIDLGARQKGYPGIVTTIAKAVSSVRFRVDWEALNYLKHTDELTVPILLFHGDADEKVPVETSDALAKARPDLVRYVRAADATHVRSWNMDPAAYQVVVRDFLQQLAR